MLSAALHVLAFVLLSGYVSPTVTFEQGASAVTLTVMPSVASRASEPDALAAADGAPPAPVSPDPPLPSVDGSPDEEQAVFAGTPEPVPEFNTRPPQEAPLLPEMVPEPVPSAPATTGRPAQFPRQTADDVAEAPEQSVEHPETESAPETVAPSHSPEAGRSASRMDSVDSNSDLRAPGISSPVRTLRAPVPRYPFASRRRGEEGDVVVDVVVLPSARTGAVNVVHSSGYRRLDRAAVRAVEEARFVPARQRGVAVAARKQFTISFRLEGVEHR